MNVLMDEKITPLDIRRTGIRGLTREDIEDSPYKFWFDAYTCKEYIDANQMWIDVLDRETKGINSDTAALLNDIFVTCAGYENKLWDELHEKQLYNKLEGTR